MELNNIYNIPCEDGINKLRENNVKIDCIITSPPYNVDLGNNKYNKNPYDLYRDNKEHTEYIVWMRDIFKSCQDILVDGGTVAINIGDGKNGSVPTHSDITQFMTKELDYVMISTIIWKKNNVSNRTSWGSWLSPSCPSFPTPFEFILLFRYKDKYSHSVNASKENITVTKDEFITNSLAIWEFGTESLKKIGHPAAFPVELPSRIIQQMTYKGDVILDIFSGSGTTALAAKKLERNYIGFEISSDYYKLSLNRLEIRQENLF